MTHLTKPVSRITANKYAGRPIVVTIGPCGGQSESLIEFRLQGTRTAYSLKLSDAFRMAALWHGQAEAKAKRDARRAGVPWRKAKRAFAESRRIPRNKPIEPLTQ
jgi:hypothetical protein